MLTELLGGGEVKFYGFARAGRRAGVRNHVLLLPLSGHFDAVIDEVSRRVAEVIAVRVHDALDGGIGEFELGVLAGFATNPNVGEVLLVSLVAAPPDMRLENMIRAAGVPVSHLSLFDAGSLDALIDSLTLSAAEAVQRRSSELRVDIDVAELIVATECGGSDGLSGLTANPLLGSVVDRLVSAGATAILGEVPEMIGAEQLLASRSSDIAVRRRLVDLTRHWESIAIDLGLDLRGAQPSPGNQAGGLSTIEEKSLGAICKVGKSPVTQVIGYGETPTRSGVVVMDTPGHDVEQLTGVVAGGAQIVVFTTGRGTPTGSPIAPTIKISTNSSIATQLLGTVDFDASQVFHHGMDATTDVLLALILAVASGQEAVAELARQWDFALPPMVAGIGSHV